MCQGDTRSITSELAVGLQQKIRKVRGTKPLAFQHQEGQLVGRIRDPQITRELEAIDDRQLWLETDVLGPQVSVSLQDATRWRPQALIKQGTHPI